MANLEVLSAAPLMESLQSIEQKIASSSHVALFLDFDGTISQIVPVPKDAVIEPGVRTALEALMERPDFSVSIVSGRALADVRQRAGLKGVNWVGNHGLEIEAGSTSFREPRAETLRRELRSLMLQLKFALGDVEGAEVEDKCFTLSVHLRRVAEHTHDWVRTTVSDIVSRSRSFSSRQGKLVLEVRPYLEWHKGSAVRYLLREVLPPGALPVYLGDDVTDEDAFRAIPEGITIKVGEPGGTQAQYLVPDVPTVGNFLTWLNQAKAHAPFANSKRAGK